jgi:hypothetical protein
MAGTVSKIGFSVDQSLTKQKSGRWSPQRSNELGPRKHEILIAFGFMTHKHPYNVRLHNVRLRIPLAIGQETRVLRLAVSQVFGVLDTPTRTLFNYDDPIQKTPD